MSDPYNGIEFIEVSGDQGSESEGISRREFLEKAAIVTGTTMLFGVGVDRMVNGKDDGHIRYEREENGVYFDESPKLLEDYQPFYTDGKNPAYAESDPEGIYAYKTKFLPPEIYISPDHLSKFDTREVLYMGFWAKEYFKFYGNSYNKQYVVDSKLLPEDAIACFSMEYGEEYIHIDTDKWSERSIADIIKSFVHELGHANVKDVKSSKKLMNPFEVPNFGKVNYIHALSLHYLDTNYQGKWVNAIEESAVDFLAEYLLTVGGNYKFDNTTVGYGDLTNLMWLINKEGYIGAKEVSKAVQNSDLDILVRGVRGVEDISDWDYIAVLCWFIASQDNRMDSANILGQIKDLRGKELSEKDFASITKSSDKAIARLSERNKELTKSLNTVV